MKNSFKIPLTLCALLSACPVIPVHAAYHIWFNDPFFSDPWDSWAQEVMDMQRQSAAILQQRLADYGPSKEDREALKAARERLNKITYDIKEDDHSVTITFTGFETLDKKDIKIVKKTNGWAGTIPTKDGKLEFFIGQKGIEVARAVELKKEEKGKEQIFRSSSLTSEARFFGNQIDLNTVKAEVKDTTLTLTAQKPQEEVLPIG